MAVPSLAIVLLKSASKPIAVLLVPGALPGRLWRALVPSAVLPFAAGPTAPSCPRAIGESAKQESATNMKLCRIGERLIKFFADGVFIFIEAGFLSALIARFTVFLRELRSEVLEELFSEIAL